MHGVLVSFKLPLGNPLPCLFINSCHNVIKPRGSSWWDAPAKSFRISISLSPRESKWMMSTLSFLLAANMSAQIKYILIAAGSLNKPFVLALPFAWSHLWWLGRGELSPTNAAARHAVRVLLGSKMQHFQQNSYCSSLTGLCEGDKHPDKCSKNKKFSKKEQNTEIVS